MRLIRDQCRCHRIHHNLKRLEHQCPEPPATTEKDTKFRQTQYKQQNLQNRLQITLYLAVHQQFHLQTVERPTFSNLNPVTMTSPSHETTIYVALRHHLYQLRLKNRPPDLHRRKIGQLRLAVLSGLESLSSKCRIPSTSYVIAINSEDVG